MPITAARGVPGLPDAGAYGIAVCLLPQDGRLRSQVVDALEQAVEAEGQTVIGWRDVPVDPRSGQRALERAPVVRMLAMGSQGSAATRSSASST